MPKKITETRKVIRVLGQEVRLTWAKRGDGFREAHEAAREANRLAMLSAMGIEDFPYADMRDLTKREPIASRFWKALSTMSYDDQHLWFQSIGWPEGFQYCKNYTYACVTGVGCLAHRREQP